jgi:hypothetical protein
MSKEQEKAGIIRDEKGRYVEGVSGNPEGRPEETEADKIKKRAINELVEEYKEGLAQSLPKISPVLIQKASQGEAWAVKEINSIIVGQAEQKIKARVEVKPFDDL